SAAPEIHAAPPRNFGSASAAAAHFAASGVALRLARQSGATVALVLATACAGVEASKSAAGLAALWRTSALVGAPWFHAAPRGNAAGIRIKRTNACARTLRARIHEYLWQRALRRRVLRHASPPPSSGANSR